MNIRDFYIFLIKTSCILGCLIGLLAAPQASALTHIPFEPFAAPLRLGVELQYGVLVDPTGTLSPEQVTALPATRFTPRQGGFAAGFTTNTFWLRVELPPQAGNGDEWWLVLSPPFMDSVRVIEPTRAGWRTHEGGDLLPLSSREVSYRDFVFRLKPHENRPLFIRVASTSTVLLFGALWQPATFATHALPDARDWGLYFGFSALSTIFVTGLALTFRQRRFFALVASSVFSGVLVAGLQGFHIWLLWPEWPQLASMSVGILVCLTSASAIWLLRECLSLQQNFPRVDKLYLGMSGVLVFSALSVPLGLYAWVSSWVTLIAELATLGALIMSIRLAMLGNRIQMAFSVAFAVHFFSVLPVLAINLGLIAPSRWLHTLWQYELLPHMLAIAGILLFEMRRAHMQWMTNQNDALLATQEAKVLLETRVQERTQKISDAQSALQIALDNESNALFEQRQFMAMISHEFRTPLAVIDATAMNLIDAPPLDGCDLQMRANQVLRATRRLTKLTDTCLADARLRDDAFALQCSDVVIETLIREAADIVTWSKNNTLKINLESAPSYWNCDSALIRIALSNLLDNAVKYGGPGEVCVKVKQAGNDLLIRVSDEGKGISEEDMLRVFERYQRGKSAPEGKGAGLGLAVVRMIIEAHGGRVYIAKKTMPGCSFELCLPDSSVFKTSSAAEPSMTHPACHASDRPPPTHSS